MSTESEISEWHKLLFDNVAGESVSDWQERPKGVVLLAMLLAIHSEFANMRASLGLPKVSLQQWIEAVDEMSRDLTQDRPPKISGFDSGFDSGFY